MPGDAGADRTLRVAGACLIVGPEREETEQRSVSTAGHGKWPRPPPAARQVLPGGSAGV